MARWQRKPMTWDWFEHYASESQIAPLLAELGNNRHKIMFVLPWSTDQAGNQSVCILSCKGTPAPKEKKEKAD